MFKSEGVILPQAVEVFKRRLKMKKTINNDNLKRQKQFLFNPRKKDNQFIIVVVFDLELFNDVVISIPYAAGFSLLLYRL